MYLWFFVWRISVPPKQMRGAEAEASVVLQVCIERGLGNRWHKQSPSTASAAPAKCPWLPQDCGEPWAEVLCLAAQPQGWALIAGATLCVHHLLPWPPWHAQQQLSPVQHQQGHVLGWAAAPPSAAGSAVTAQLRRAAQLRGCLCKALGDDWHSLLTAYHTHTEIVFHESRSVLPLAFVLWINCRHKLCLPYPLIQDVLL